MKLSGEKSGQKERHALVSVIIPVYNGERVVSASVKSVLHQSYESMELIIIDDGSRDGTFEKLCALQEKLNVDFLKVLKHEKNLGLAATLNHGLLESKGKYVLVLHQDCELARGDWVQKAVGLFDDESVAVITGYYGIPCIEDDTLTKKAFGILRKQFHARPSGQTLEELTFSEGKCDLYRRELLLKHNLFPTRFRIAGEDLETSFRLRSLGYKIIKDYDLPVIQRFSGKAETLFGNLEKEFVFGKAMGAVLLMFGFFLFKGLGKTSYSRSRSLHRASQPPYILLLILNLCAYLLLGHPLLLVLLAILILSRYIYYFVKVYIELRLLTNARMSSLARSFAIASLGIPTDIVYSAGLSYGVVLYLLGKRI